MPTSPLLESLREALRCLPGVGAKSVQCMAFHLLLQRNRPSGQHLAETLRDTMSKIKRCSVCQTFTEEERCTICSNSCRVKNGQLCVVESPADVEAIEQTGQFLGRYFVLMGRLSPLGGIGSGELGLDLLARHLESKDITEVIVATSPTLEGDVTATYIAEMCKPRSILASRIAYGVPIGGELEMVDGTTLSHSLTGRRPITL